jgi:hypothetical protein
MYFFIVFQKFRGAKISAEKAMNNTQDIIQIKMGENSIQLAFLPSSPH